MRVHIATDHAGFELKEKIVADLREKGYDVVDHGAHVFDALDDYPPFCIEAAQAVVDEPGSLGIVIGGSGAGKTRFFCKPNLMQANCSFLVTDPKGETMRAVAPLLIEKGYVIKVFDLIDTDRSDAFNPFPYLKDDKDAMKLVNNLIKNTTPKNSTNNDPFWEKSEIALDTALILYLLHEAPPEEQNLEMVMYMIENGGAREDDDDFQSPLDMLFEALEEEEPDHVAVREYKIFKQAAGKTAKSI